MASNNDRLPVQPSGLGLSDDGDSRRLHPTLSNSMSDDGRLRRPRGSASSQQNPYNLDSSRYQQARQPINDAVTSAFNNADATSTASFSPDLLHQITSQITANVLQQLKASNLPVPSPQSQVPTSQMDAASSTAGSPPLDRATVYTPPSPFRTSEDTGIGQPSPKFPPPPSQPSFRASSPSFDKRAVSPVSQGSHLSEGEANQSRPRGPKRMSTGGDATILERVWGTLFTEQGEATPRLGQFLRGIAVHLIEDYEPKHSLVITPTKIQRYYEETKLDNELYPWKIVFDDRTSSISRMFREIECQHHLVQDKLSERPDIPGLTPQGFQTWAMLLLKAHPDQEFERLAKTALDMPISNPDEKKERFPKELSRRLFPKHPDTEIAYKLQKAMSAHCNVNFASRNDPSAEAGLAASQSSVSGDESSKKSLRPSQEKQDAVSNATQASPALSQAGLERQRQPYSGTTAENVNSFEGEDTEDVPTPQPIERERKPYVAAPGLGKNYNNLDKPAVTIETKPPPPPPEAKPRRSNSVQANNRSNDAQRSNTTPIAIHQRPPPPPMEIPDARHNRSNSIYHRDPARPGRNRSPSMTKENGGSSYMRRPDADPSYLSSSHHSDQYDEARRYRDYEAQRERLANDRYDAARMAAYDPRDRERDRDSRPRMPSASAFDAPPLSARGGPPPYSTSIPPSVDEEYYHDRGHPSSTNAATYSVHSTPTSISTGFQPPPPPVSSATRDSGYGSYPTSAGYPPSSYRDVR